MAITCTGYVINASGAWARKGAGSAALGSAQSMHAERAAFGALPTSTVYLLVQDAFPCGPCHAWLQAQSGNGHSIVVKVTANNGAYSADHGFGLKGGTPCIIYYHGGTARYDSISHTMAGTGGAHPNFPVYPDIGPY